MRNVAVLLSIVIAAGFHVAAQHAATNSPTSSSRTVEVNCGLRTYHDALDAAFTQAAGDGEKLTVQVLMSFEREYALILKRSPSGVTLVQVMFRKQLWSELKPLHVQKTRQQCLEEAKTAELDIVPIEVSAAETERLWNEFAKIKLVTSECPQRGGKCVHLLDGGGYIVQASGRSVRITETDGLRGVTSENPALLDWIHSVLAIAAKQTPVTPGTGR